MLLKEQTDFVVMGNMDVHELYYYVSGKSPDIRGVDIIEQTKIEISPDQPLDYHWKGHGFKVQIPAGAIATTGPVTRGENITLMCQ